MTMLIQMEAMLYRVISSDEHTNIWPGKTTYGEQPFISIEYIAMNQQ